MYSLDYETRSGLMRDSRSKVVERVKSKWYIKIIMSVDVLGV